MDDERIPYRARITDLPSDASRGVATIDEQNYDTLALAYKQLKTSVEELDGWHAFDLTEKDGLTIKQQIKAHQLAFEILAPVLSALETAVATVDNKYKER